MYLTPIGEDTLLLCDGCGYSANRQIATFKRESADREDLLEKEEIETPNMQTIEELAAFLDIPTRKTSKAVFMMATTGEGEAQQDRFVLAVIRGDMEVNETKLANAVGAREMWAGYAEEIAAVGAVPGYGSPLGVEGALVVVDPSVADATNLVAGANRAASIRETSTVVAITLRISRRILPRLERETAVRDAASRCALRAALKWVISFSSAPNIPMR